MLKAGKMKEKTKFESISKFLKKEFPESILPKEECHANKIILEKLGLNPSDSIYLFYQNYETDCLFIDQEERLSSTDFLFDEMALLADIPDLWEYIQNEWKVSKEYLPISNAEAGYCFLYQTDTGKVFFCDLDLADNVAQNAERTWNNFEDFLLDYLDIKTPY